MLRAVLFLLLFLIISCQDKTEETTIPQSNTPATPIHSQELPKFSMFIHWGLYSIPGGVWNGKNVTKGYSEQIRAHGNIAKEEYTQLAAQFNPSNWDPDQIVALAKEAGMQSIVITSKHHDGFSLFNTRHSSFDVMDATPYKRDIIKELSEACRQQGIGFGIYFSLIDWHLETGSGISSHNADPITPELEELNANQIEELVTQYGPLDQFWFDMGSPSLEQSQRFRDIVKTHQPDCFISSRISNNLGDFYVMGDNQYPDYQIDAPWQVPASMFDETWGYRSWQARGNVNDKVAEKLTQLMNVNCEGGSYLLNIGPKGDGSLVEFEVDVLRGIGNWMNKFSNSIYNSQRSPWGIRSWGGVSHDPVQKKLFLHLTDYPEDNILKLYGLNSAIDDAYPLIDPNTKLAINRSGNNFGLDVSGGYTRHPVINTFVIQYSGDLTIIPIKQVYPQQNQYELTLKNANSYKAFMGSNYYETIPVNTRITWDLYSNISSTYQVEAQYTNQESGKTIWVKAGNGSPQEITLENTNPIEIPAPNSVAYSDFKYVNPPYSPASMEYTHGQLYNLSFKQKWGYGSGREWVDYPGWEQGDIVELPGGELSALYVAQSIYSPEPQILMSSIGSDDGLVVWSNGELIAKTLTPAVPKPQKVLLEIPLQGGNNQLIYKFYNTSGSFHTTVQHDVVVARFHQDLGQVNLEPGIPTRIEIYGDNPKQDLGLINFKIVVKPLN